MAVKITTMDSGYLKSKVDRINKFYLGQINLNLEHTVFADLETQQIIDEKLVEARLLLLDISLILKEDNRKRHASSAKQSGSVRGYKNGKTLYKK